MINILVNSAAGSAQLDRRLMSSLLLAIMQATNSFIGLINQRHTLITHTPAYLLAAAVNLL